jgi:hypothetical protein
MTFETKVPNYFNKLIGNIQDGQEPGARHR